jgi:hypothetical protein
MLLSFNSLRKGRWGKRQLLNLDAKSTTFLGWVRKVFHIREISFRWRTRGRLVIVKGRENLMPSR